MGLDCGLTAALDMHMAWKENGAFGQCSGTARAYLSSSCFGNVFQELGCGHLVQSLTRTQVRSLQFCSAVRLPQLIMWEPSAWTSAGQAFFRGLGVQNVVHCSDTYRSLCLQTLAP